MHIGALSKGQLGLFNLTICPYPKIKLQNDHKKFCKYHHRISKLSNCTHIVRLIVRSCTTPDFFPKIYQNLLKQLSFKLYESFFCNYQTTNKLVMIISYECLIKKVTGDFQLNYLSLGNPYPKIKLQKHHTKFCKYHHRISKLSNCTHIVRLIVRSCITPDFFPKIYQTVLKQLSFRLYYSFFVIIKLLTNLL